jgi:membrane complex biogenesis BtpA family protein
MNKFPNLIGVIHLSPLSGSPGAGKSPSSIVLAKALSRAKEEAKVLAQNGFDGMILENFGDIPFYKNSVPPETVASLAIIAASIRESAPRVKLGINVLRNDAKSALAIAAVTGADFIRINVLSGVSATDQGIIEGEAAGILRERLRLNAENVLILADVHVKHAQSLSSNDISLAIEEVSGRGGADAVIISGSTTGRAPLDAKLLDAVHAAKVCGIPLYIGSGATIDSLPKLAKHSVKVIVGSALRKNGKAGADLQLQKVKDFSRAFAKAKHK